MKQEGLTPATWQLLTSTWLKAASKAGTDTATAVLAANSQPAIDAKRRVIVLAAVGAAGLILTLLVRSCSAGPSTAGSARCAAPR